MDVLDWGVCLPGFKAAGVRDGKYGVALIISEEDCMYSGLYTKNAAKAAPVEIMLSRGGTLKGIVANSGNANACMKSGVDDAGKVLEKVAGLVGCDVEKLGVASTGIIGRPIDVGKVSQLAESAFGKLECTPKASEDAADAIRTTDTCINMYAVEVSGVQVGGICKGAGMIDPAMATMLCFITTNAKMEKIDLDSILHDVVDDTFNMISTDGDNSTNDCVMVLSNQTQKCSLEDFKTALSVVCGELSKMIAFDGEGAGKQVTVEVSGAKSKGEAKTAVKAIMNSNLVKTALAGDNPNWGRIMGALGSAISFDWKKTSITYKSGGSEYVIVDNGEGRDLGPAEELLKNEELTLKVDLAQGDSSAIGYTCDLTEGYIKINTEYS